MSRENHIGVGNWACLTKRQKIWIETAPDSELLRMYAWMEHRSSDDLYDAIGDWILTTPYKTLNIKEVRFIYPRKKPHLNHTSIDPGMLDALLCLI